LTVTPKKGIVKGTKMFKMFFSVPSSNINNLLNLIHLNTLFIGLWHRAYREAKNKGVSFSLLLLHRIITAAAKVEEFRYRIDSLH